MSDLPERFTVTVVGDGADESFTVSAGKPMLNALVGRPDAPVQVGCRGGGCGVCRIHVLEGDYTTRRMSRRFVTAEDEASGFALACRTTAESDLVVRYVPIAAPT